MLNIKISNINFEIKKITNRKFRVVQSIDLFQFRRRLRILIYKLRIRDNSNRIENVVLVLVQEKNRLKRIKLTTFKSLLFTKIIETLNKDKNYNKSIVELKNSNIAINLDNNATSYKLEQQNKIVCVEEDLIAIAKILKKIERVVIFVDIEISTNCNILVSCSIYQNKQI